MDLTFRGFSHYRSGHNWSSSSNYTIKSKTPSTQFAFSPFTQKEENTFLFNFFKKKLAFFSNQDSKLETYWNDYFFQAKLIWYLQDSTIQFQPWHKKLTLIKLQPINPRKPILGHSLEFKDSMKYCSLLQYWNFLSVGMWLRFVFELVAV